MSKLGKKPRQFALLSAAAIFAVTFFSGLSARAGGPVIGRVIDIIECTAQSGVLKNHDLAVVRVYKRIPGGISTFVIYSTHPAHGLNQPRFLQLARDSKANDKYLSFYWSEEKGSNICGIPGRYHFIRNIQP